MVSDGLLSEIESCDFFSYGCDQPKYYHIAGVVIPSTHSKKRAQTRQKIIVNGKKYLVVSIPNSLIRQCRINWSDLLRALADKWSFGKCQKGRRNCSHVWRTVYENSADKQITRWNRGNAASSEEVASASEEMNLQAEQMKGFADVLALLAGRIPP